MIVYRYDESGSEPELTMSSTTISGGTIDVEIQAGGVAVLYLQNVGADFDFATHASLAAAAMAPVIA